MDELNFLYKGIRNLRKVQDQNKNEETFIYKKTLIRCI